MSHPEDEAQIRDLIDTWLKASAAGDVETVLGLMTDDIAFLLPGRPPMRRAEFAEASRAQSGKMKIEGKSDIQEITVEGNYAYCWNHLSITITPEGGAPMRRAGNILSVFRKEAEGKWRLHRDANLLQPVIGG
ncbi:MAG TPA: SgcJ/EcaC family oxidoreductase [Chthoniobacteraceae bacterium]|nr:SgcJ/EcaC family oxidoreductase [Chthoniobacteraceae bacterium]